MIFTCETSHLLERENWLGRVIIGLALLFLLLSVLEVSCSAVPKAVETIVFDDFESYYTGAFPYSGGWEL